MSFGRDQRVDDSRSATPEINPKNQNLAEITAESIEALETANDPIFLFSHAGRLTRVESASLGGVTLRPMTIDRVRRELAEAADWIWYDRNDNPHTGKPPRDVAANILATPDLPFPVLEQVVRAPIFGPDGSLQQHSGYNPTTRILYQPPADLNIPEVSMTPTRAELLKAKKLILTELLGDFPFVGSAGKAHSLCALLEPFVRPRIIGPVPIYVIVKPTPGTGGTLLTDALAYPALGEDPPKLTVPGNEGEFKRMLFSALRDSPIVLAIDNLPEGDRLKSPALASMITANQHRDRVVGTSETLVLSVRCTWITNGNNPSLARDLARRSVFIRIDAADEAPDERKNFKHPDLKLWTRQNRGDLVWAALTICQAWVAEGMPSGDGTMGMFESWARTMSGILEVGKIPGFLSDLQERRDQVDQGTLQLEAFVQVWAKELGDKRVPAGELLKYADGLDLGSDEKSRGIRLGQLLSSSRDRKFGDFFIRRGKLLNGRQTWFLEKASD
jgi:hypothetical protein